MLSLLDVRRRRQFTCPPCGAKLEIVIAGWPYYLVTLSVSIFGTLLVPILLLLFLAQEWYWGVALIALLVAMMLGSNAFLRRLAVVQRAPQSDPKAPRPGYQD